MITVKWQDDAFLDANGFHTIRPHDGTVHGNIHESPIATVYTEEAANLIAAAPALLEAAKQTIEALKDTQMSIFKMPPLLMLQAALALAEPK
jgi:hypothetical protein